jgi:YfiH family protein
MIIHNEPLCAIAFGDKKTAIDTATPHGYEKNLIHLPQCSSLKLYLHAQHIASTKQVHGTQGITLKKTETTYESAHTHQADFIMTNMPRLGIAIKTADCLPIIIHDYVHQAMAIVHAGWRGTVNDIAQKAFHAMQKEYGTKPSHIKVFFGPCSRVCCYTVTQDIVDMVTEKPYGAATIMTRQRGYAFDLPRYNQHLLESEGIPKEAFHYYYNTCTICDPNFCSYRRDKTSQRQLAIATLK